MKRVNTILDHATPLMGKLEMDGVTLTCGLVHCGVGLHRKGLAVDMHRHDSLQFELVPAGRFRFATPHDSRVIGPRAGVVFAPTQQHMWECVSEGLLMGIEVAVDGPQKERFVRQMLRQGGGRLVPIAKDLCAERWDEILELALSHPPALWQEELLGCRLTLWLADAMARCFRLGAWRRAHRRGRRPVDRGRQICARATEFMSANCDRRLHLAEIALHAGTSARSLVRFFRQHTGRSVNDTLMRLRLEKARAMLEKDPERSVKEVAYALGFSTPHYFAKCFRDAFGMLPSSLRASSASGRRNPR